MTANYYGTRHIHRPAKLPGGSTIPLALELYSERGKRLAEAVAAYERAVARYVAVLKEIPGVTAAPRRARLPSMAPQPVADAVAVPQAQRWDSTGRGGERSGALLPEGEA